MTKSVTLCVVDDIKSVIEGISRGIPWEEYGVDLVGTSLNGEDGLRMIRDLEPEIVLTDIRMPMMDGLEMTEHIMEVYPSCKVILLSGYADFEYAQAAIRIGAFDFVKKPFSIQEIVDVVLKAKKEIEAERSKELSLQAMEQKLRESMPVLRQEYFSLLLHHKTHAESAMERWTFLQVDMEPYDIAVMVMEIDGFMERSAHLPVREAELIRFALQNIVEETVREHTMGVIFRETQHRFVLLVNAGEEDSLGQLVEQIRMNIERYTKFTISIGIGPTVKGPGDLAESYQIAAATLAYHFYTEGNAVFHYSEIHDSRQKPPHVVWDKEEEILFALRSANKEKLLVLLETMKNDIRSLDVLPRPETSLLIYGDLLSLVIRVLLERLPYEVVQPLEIRCLELRSRESNTLQELQQACAAIVMEACTLLDTFKLSEAEETVNYALAYIGEHLDANLTVNAVAKQVHLSSSYFASLFKKVTGLTFIQHITQERLKKAKSMLIEGKQIQEIALALGYEERRYFSDVFKKHTGMTPSEFRQAYMDGTLGDAAD